jgi:hypothetical protein
MPIPLQQMHDTLSLHPDYSSCTRRKRFTIECLEDEEIKVDIDLQFFRAELYSDKQRALDASGKAQN